VSVIMTRRIPGSCDVPSTNLYEQEIIIAKENYSKLDNWM